MYNERINVNVNVKCSNNDSNSHNYLSLSTGHASATRKAHMSPLQIKDQVITPLDSP